MSPLRSLEAIRAEFPALAREHGGRPVAYFDGPGGTQVPRPVVNAMADYLFHHNANTHWAYPTSVETDGLLLLARDMWGDFLNGDKGEVIFGNNMTTLTMHLARTLVRGWEPGDEVIVTELDHHANVAPWQALARDNGIVLRWLPMDVETGTLRLDLLPALLSPKTRLLAIGAASNILGTISDVRACADLAHAAGALVFVDGVHYAPHVLPDVRALGADFFACSVYKFYGPHVGILWGRRELLEALAPPKLEPAPDDAAEKFETGTQNHEGIIGAAAALGWLAGLSGVEGTFRQMLAATYEGLHARETELFARLWDGLGNIRGVTRYGLPAGGTRTGTVSLSIAGVASQDAAVALAAEGCFVSNGDFYASTVARKLGFAEQGLLRIGTACYTIEGEIDRVLEGIERVARSSP